MNINSLKCFILVAENLSFARTAEAMHKSQPAVTKQINALENELGVTLFLRSPRHVELTPAGMSFYKDARDIVISTERAVERAKKQESGENTISLGLSNPAALFCLTPLLSRLHEEIPDLRPSIQVLNHKTILSLFAEVKLDALFFYRENAPEKTDASFKELQKDSCVCLLPKGHPFEKKEILSLDDLSRSPLIVCNPLSAPLATASLQQRLLERCSPERVFYCDTVEIAHTMVAAGMGLSLLPGLLCLKSPDFSTAPIEGGDRLSFGIFYRRQNRNPVLKRLLKIISS
ncbi:MAG TPA: LysR family transcriptional regulator [Candidatus Copromorpha excrementigallinarum]|uniref:LysR family transcriptional regulator n=1 Tax=Candidatus Allocopromorpha excrementigallinarum TaxID=2840742 RepID=A0A9D1HZI5_9FIRM|nr:LysR family transcriptional regulator [Candidatus Copromorpha excrementigallinarum]